MLGLGIMSLFLRYKNRLYQSKFFLRYALLMGPTGLIAILAGWYTTEIGRQPWIVYGLMRTEDAVSNHSATTLSISLIIFIVMYFGVFGTGINYLLRLIARGPNDTDDHHDGDHTKRPARPLSAAPDNIDPTIDLGGE